jgi:hypothetical protein
VRKAIGAAALAAAALGAGCGSGDPPEPLPLRSLVLQDSDLPAAFEPFAVGAALRAEGASRRDDRTRFGRRRGWSASYRRPGSVATEGPLVVVSRVDEFGDATGAERSVAGVREMLIRVGRELAAPGVGDEAVAFVQTRRGAGPPARFFTIAWRQAELTATLRVSGFARGLDTPQALTLARTQHGRMARALASR